MDGWMDLCSPILIAQHKSSSWQNATHSPEWQSGECVGH